jgi:hypothetical protein
MLRGANDYMLDEMDRSLHDSLCVVKRVLESGSVVPGRRTPPPGGDTFPGCCCDAMNALCSLFVPSAGVVAWVQALLLQAKHSVAAMRRDAVGASTTV